MNYNILWDSKALSDLKQFDRTIAKKIVSKVTSYLVQDPINLGKTLSANFKGLMRYRFGDYRIIYEVNDIDHTIIIIKVGHRKDVYKD